jgi:hypothetical protein
LKIFYLATLLTAARASSENSFSFDSLTFFDGRLAMFWCSFFCRHQITDRLNVDLKITDRQNVDLQITVHPVKMSTSKLPTVKMSTSKL